ncbi:MAG TPA: hypothetical protein VF073_07580 [Gaiella sp.]
MSPLGDILELLHGAAEHARPARLTVVEWAHGPRSAAAFDRFMAARHGASYTVARSVASGDTPPSDTTSWTTTLSYESPTRFREESAGVQKGTRATVRDGERWASWDADWGAVTSESADEQGAPSSTHGFLLDPVGLVSALRLEPGGETDVAGRPARLVHGVPRDDRNGAESALFRIGPGADVVELAIDAEYGALLRSEALLGGEPFHRLEVKAIVFGPLPASTFELSLPAGFEASGGWLRPRRLPLHELALAAPFRVFVPSPVPEGWRIAESLLTPGREHPPIEPRIHLSYASREGAYVVNIEERAAGGGDDGWRTWVRDGDLERADAGEHVEPRHHVRLEREGTVVELAGADPTLLAALARSLVAASIEPPRL